MKIKSPSLFWLLKSIHHAPFLPLLFPILHAFHYLILFLLSCSLGFLTFSLLALHIFPKMTLVDISAFLPLLTFPSPLAFLPSYLSGSPLLFYPLFLSSFFAFLYPLQPYIFSSSFFLLLLLYFIIFFTDPSFLYFIAFLILSLSSPLVSYLVLLFSSTSTFLSYSLNLPFEILYGRLLSEQ